MKVLLVVCLITAILCQAQRSIKPVGQQIGQPIGGTSEGEFAIASGSAAEKAIQQLLSSSSDSNAAAAFQSEKNKKPTTSELQAAKASIAPPAGLAASGNRIGGGASSLTIGRPRPIDDYWYPNYNRRLVCRTTYYPEWRLCCYYTWWWWY